MIDYDARRIFREAPDPAQSSANKSDTDCGWSNSAPGCPRQWKTTVLVTRLGYLVYCQGIAPASILTMTYTVAATKEMKSRFAKQFGDEYAAALEFRTINGLSAKIIDYYSRNYGRRKPFQLLTDGSETARLVSQIYQTITEEFATPQYRPGHRYDHYLYQKHDADSNRNKGAGLRHT